MLTAVTFSLFGFIIGIWADGFEKLQIIPLLIVTPLTFLGGSFYSINMLPPLWQTVALFNPVVYLICGFRWSFYGISDVSVGVSLGMTAGRSSRLPGHRLVDLQDRLPAEGLTLVINPNGDRPSRKCQRRAIKPPPCSPDQFLMRALTMSAAGRWNKRPIPDIVDAGDGEFAAQKQARRPKV